MSAPEHDKRPWPPGPRRDAPPHRGKLLLRAGHVANVCAFLTVFVVPAVVAVVLGAAVWLIARHDVAAMDRDELDQTGRDLTRRAKQEAVSAFHTLVGLAGCAALLVMLVMLVGLWWRYVAP